MVRARFFDLYEMSVENWNPELIYENNEGLNISAISHHENYFSLDKSITTSEDKLFL